ncbi:hypothetical protein C0991_000253 [Blastosporella zonata]|nr:hypothetical protein C0991_000253 [Blastosporella zonata]
MPSHRTADAAQIAPYLTHFVSHHGQVTLAPADNNGRVRQANTKGDRIRQRQDRNARTEEEVRFNVGPRSLRNLVSNRGVKRGGRQDRDRGETDEAYPNYPPPSFLEATSVPPSPCNATLLTPSQPASPIISGECASTLPKPTDIPALTMAPKSENDPDSDASSLEIIDMASLPLEEQLPSGSKLEENIKRDWINRRGVEFPSPPESQVRGRSKNRVKALLDSDTEDEVHDAPRQSSSRSKNGSLSPLRTLFPYRSMTVDQPFSASPNPSPYSSRSSLPFLSATSLKMSMSTTSISSVKGEGFFSRRLMSFKGKERARESLDAWEVVDSDPSPTLENTSSPVRSQSFTYGMPVPQTHAVKEPIQPAPAPTTTVTTPHPLSLRDRKPPPVPFVTRPRRPAPPPPPKLAESLPVPRGPMLTSVRTRKPPPPPKKSPRLASSPLGHDSWRPSSLDVDVESNAMLQRAIATPLPLSPIDVLSENVSPTCPILLSPAENISVCKPTPISPTAPAPNAPMVTWESDGLARGTSPDLPSMPGDYPEDDESSSPISIRPPSPLPGPLPTPRRHYPGRPLPQPPGTTRPLVDSIYAAHDDPLLSPTFTGSQCPEGLLIDLDDSSTVEAASSHLAPLLNDDMNPFATPSYATSSSSSVDLLGSIADLPSPVITQEHQPSRADTPPANQLATPFSQITDLDVLISRISDEEQQDGSDYDALLLLSEFIGPATPPRVVSQPASVPPDTPPRPTQHNVASPVTSVRSPPTSFVNIPRLGNVRVERRRTTKDGRVKLKLGLFDAAVDKCGICLTQFRSGDAGQLGSACRHAFHEKCLGRWLIRSKTCPMCRLPFTLEQAPL